MGDSFPKVKVAAVQAASVFLDREATTEKACRLIREAGRNGARVIGFPEGFIPAHPVWYHHHAATGAHANKLAIELFKNAVEIPGPAVADLCAAARDAGAYVVMGVCEKLPDTLGTMFNTQIQIGPDGTLIGKHQKFMPTVGERLVHALGHGNTFGTFRADFGPMSGLICGENGNPLAQLALTAEGTRIHVMSWPPYFTLTADRMRNRVLMDSQAFSNVSGAYVISCCSTIDDATLALVKPGAEDEKVIREPMFTGGSVIVGPNGRVVAGPMGSEEGILYAECDFDASMWFKLRQDFAGHYNRPDIFQLHTNRSAPQLYSVWHAPGATRLAETAPAAVTSSVAPPLALPKGAPREEDTP